MPRAMLVALGFGALGFAIACGASGANDGETSASEVTTTPDAGGDASAECRPCAERFAEGKRKYEATRRGCFCADDICQDACAKTLCARPSIDPDSACDACVNESYSRCLQGIQTTCEADEDCLNYVVCKVDAVCG